MVQVKTPASQDRPRSLVGDGWTLNAWIPALFGGTRLLGPASRNFGRLKHEDMGSKRIYCNKMGIGDDLSIKHMGL